MAGKAKETPDTTLLLGEIKGSVKAVDQKLAAQNGAINHLRESINGLSGRIDKLPCDVHSERINTCIATSEKETEKESAEHREKRRGRRDLFIALVAALFTGAFMLVGIWLSQGAP